MMERQFIFDVWKNLKSVTARPVMEIFVGEGYQDVPCHKFSDKYE